MAIIINIVVMVMTRMTRMVLTYGLWVLSWRIGVVVVVTGGDVGVGVSPFVLDTCTWWMASVLVSRRQ